MTTTSTTTYPNHQQIPKTDQLNQEAGRSTEARKLLVVRKEVFFIVVQAAMVILPVDSTTILQEVVLAPAAEVT
jgi:hypothetical protein